MFSANQTISPSGLKTLVVAKGRENGIGRGRTALDGAGNGVGRERIGSDGGMGSDEAGNRVR